MSSQLHKFEGASFLDTHFHIWDLKHCDPVFPTPDMVRLTRDYTIEDLMEAIRCTPIKGAIHVQVTHTKKENKWIANIAKNHPVGAVIKGIVAWMDLFTETPESDVSELKAEPLVVGIRYILSGYRDNVLEQAEAIQPALSALCKAGLTLDLPCVAGELEAAYNIAKRNPELRIVIDHIGRPNIKTGEDIPEWKINITKLSKLPNVYCKVSGMVTQADWSNWKTSDMLDAARHCVVSFGINRCMFGSNWPVMLLADTDYRKDTEMMFDVVTSMLDDEALVGDVESSGGHSKAIDKIFRENGCRFYGIKI